MIGVVGTIFSLALLIFLVYRGWGVIQTSFLAAIVVIITNNTSSNFSNFFTAFKSYFLGIPQLLEGGTYSAATGLSGFISSNLFIIITGALFGTIMAECGAAKSIAYGVSKRFGAKNAIMITIIASTVLTAGGISAFVCMFTVFPLVINLFKEADIPRKYLIGAYFTGASTFTVCTLPGIPTVHNLTPTPYLGTTIMAAPLTGIICSVFTFTACYIYLKTSSKRAIARGEHFVVNNDTDAIHLNDVNSTEELPPFFLSLIAPIMTIVLSIISNYTVVANGICSSNDAVSFALILVTLYCIVVFRKFIPDIMGTITKGIQSGLGPIFFIGSVVAFGTVVSYTEAYNIFRNFALNLRISPYYSTVISVNILAGITASGLGGLRIFMSSCSEHFIKLGLDPQLFHRVACMSCVGLDSLPHNGGLVTTLKVMGSDYKESYFVTFIVTTIITLAAAFLGATIATIIT
ncbi:MAG: hypothetical protein AAGU76_13790 [Sedimentibacter sp.]|uniref:GntP family permease n=1 Tax=Sedimentibacter sp. TaxID=1960295 RepID=UPI003158646F